MRPNRKLLAAVLLGSLILHGCGPSVPTRPEANDKTINAVKQLSITGQHAQAAQRYLALAEKESTPFKQSFQLDAVDNFAKAGDLQRGLGILAGMNLQGTDDLLKARHAILGARLALAANQPQRAINALKNAPAKASIDQLITFQSLRIEAWDRLGQAAQALQARIDLGSLLYDPKQFADNRAAIWKRLSALSRDQVQSLQMTATAPELAGWLALADIDKGSRFNPEAYQQKLADWRLRYPNHSAAGDFLDLLSSQRATPLTTPAHIALLLPLKGRYAPQASAIRDGFISALYGDQSLTSLPDVRIYDTQEGKDTLNQYQQALSDGAQMVVGPLSKHGVSMLASEPDLAVPVLTLNRSDTPASSQLYQFGLPPEDEAAAVAAKVWQDGLEQAAVIVPEGRWGDRLTDAFRDGMSRTGGEVIDVIRIPAGSDYRKVLEQGLHLHYSNERKKRLTQTLRTKVEFEPRRRQDLDALLVAVTPQQMRLLRPQLQFHHAETVPIYATSRSYSCFADPDADRDLNGVIVADSPWRLADDANAPAERLAVSRAWPGRNETYGALFALGVDSYRLLPYAPHLRDVPDKTIQGATGILSMDSDGRIRRQPEFGIFRSGTPVMLPRVQAATDSAPPLGSSERIKY